MKIICVGRNYAEHAKELNNPVPKEPVLFLKPDTALLPKKMPFFIPDFSKDVHYEAEIVVKINRVGKHIEKKFAKKYYSDVSLGIDFTARDIQSKLKEKGLPWERAKAFDGSAPVGTFIPISQLVNSKNIRFELFINNERKQLGFSKDMIFSIETLICEISKIFTLKIGDLIFTGTPSGVGQIKIGDQLEGYLEDKKVLNLKVR
jgi:2-keto-4-pentenoate hydratase/2-oxohepta-3-ene-1,7-dioic acid hydratase in catechol pathway